MGGPLTLLAYNSYLLPPPLDTGQRVRAGLIPAQLPGHDVIVLSEVFDQSLRHQLLTRLRPEYPHVTSLLGHARLAGASGGVVLLSRWPLRHEQQVLFGTRCRGMDCFAAKGAKYACLERGGQRYHLLGTHLQAGESRAAASIRAQQLELIKGFIEQLRLPANEPVIIAGDLNVDRLDRAREYQQMLHTLDADCALPCPLEPSYDPQDNPLCNGPREQLIDHVLWSRAHRAPSRCSARVQTVRSERPWRQGVRDLSDHHAVAVELEF